MAQGVAVRLAWQARAPAARALGHGTRPSNRPHAAGDRSALLRRAPTLMRRSYTAVPSKLLSKLVPMAKKAFSWDMSVASEGVWFSFKDEGAPELLQKFRTAADSDFGGQSHCTLELTERGTALFSGELSLSLADRGDEHETGNAGAPSVKQRLAKWFAGERPRTAKGGFVAIASFPHALEPDIDDFNTLCLRVKSDGRIYCVNLKTEALPLESVYQAVLVPKKVGVWEDVEIKASDFTLTHRGLVNVHKVNMNWRSIKTFGISLMDRQDGPFRLEIESVGLKRLEDVDGTDAL